MPELANYIRVDRASNWVFQAFLVCLVMFTIFNTFLMSVLEREREFAVQMALGARPIEIMSQVLCETIYLGLIGCIAGLALGTALALYLDYAAFDLSPHP
jgi:putative ABC transport system permease protein